MRTPAGLGLRRAHGGTQGREHVQRRRAPHPRVVLQSVARAAAVQPRVGGRRRACSGAGPSALSGGEGGVPRPEPRGRQASVVQGAAGPQPEPRGRQRHRGPEGVCMQMRLLAVPGGLLHGLHVLRLLQSTPARTPNGAAAAVRSPAVDQLPIRARARPAALHRAEPPPSVAAYAAGAERGSRAPPAGDRGAARGDPPAHTHTPHLPTHAHH